MHITLRQLQIFAAIAQSGSTTAAGTQIALSQSAVSASIAELERVLSVLLFDRIGKRLILNDHGRAMLPQALSQLKSAADLEQSYLSDSPSLLVIGASLTIGNYLLPRLLADYWRSQGIVVGDTNPPLQVVIHNTVEIAAKVANLEVDIGLVEGPCHRSDIAITPWLKDELLLVASPDHPIIREYNGGLVPFSRMAKANWLLREQGSGTREALENVLLPHLPQLKSHLEFNDNEAIKQSAVRGLGVACLSELIVSDMIEAGRLVEIKTDFVRIPRRFSLLIHHQKKITKGMQRFIDFATMPQS